MPAFVVTNAHEKHRRLSIMTKVSAADGSGIPPERPPVIPRADALDKLGFLKISNVKSCRVEGGLKCLAEAVNVPLSVEESLIELLKGAGLFFCTRSSIL